MSDIEYARAGDLFIAYKNLGSGSLDLLELGGLVTNLEVAQEWPPLVRYRERIATFCRLILFDKRGVGLSDRPTHVAPEDVLDDISRRDGGGRLRARRALRGPRRAALLQRCSRPPIRGK